MASCLGVFHCNVNNPPFVLPEQSNQTEFSAAVQYEGIIYPYADTKAKDIPWPQVLMKRSLNWTFKTVSLGSETRV